MTVHVITAVRRNANNRVTDVRWAVVDPETNSWSEPLHDSPVINVVDAIAFGDKVYSTHAELEGNLIGDQVEVIVLASGLEIIQSQLPSNRPDRTLADLPTF